MNINLSPFQEESWTKLDASKATTFRRCRREYLMEYIYGWRTSAIQTDLDVGRAWHKAMEHLLLNPTDWEGAFQAYMDCYRKSFTLADDALLKEAKQPTNIERALREYTLQWTGPDVLVPLHIEVPGKLKLTEDSELSYYAKIDAVVRLPDGRYAVVDHKTTSIGTDDYRRSWNLHHQMQGYMFLVSCVVPEEELSGAIMNCVMLSVNAQEGKIVTRGPRKGLPYANQGKGNTFFRHHIPCHPDQQQAWYSEMTRTASDIINETNLLLAIDRPDFPQQSFPRSPQHCLRYNKLCPYFALCEGNPNAHVLYESLGGQPPQGFQEAFWDPEVGEPCDRTGKPVAAQPEARTTEMDTLMQALKGGDTECQT